MSGLGKMWEDLMPEITRTLGETAAHPGRGETVILSRPSSLQDVAGDIAPSHLVVAGAGVSAGATALILALESAGRMAGTLLAGARLFIAGAEYLLTADAPASGMQISVALGSPLAVGLALGAAVEVRPEARFSLLNCQVSQKSQRPMSGAPNQADIIAVVTVPAKGAPATPRQNDVLQLEDGTIGRVSAKVISTGAFWKLRMGA